jgi:hypothetical protein
MTTLNWSRTVPVSYEADVAVIGGGIAGVSAACAAAQSGARVVLVERFGVTGGNMTVGGVANFCGETRGQGRVFDEIVQELEDYRAIAPYAPYVPDPGKMHDRVLDHEILAFVLQEMLLRHGVRLLLHTRFVDAQRSGDRIAACIVCGASGPEALLAKQYIDCSGEAQLAWTGGFPTVKGRPEDGLQLPMSMMFFVREMDGAVEPQIPEGKIERIGRIEDLPMTTPWPNGPNGKAIKIKIPGFDSTLTGSLSAAELQARRRMMQVLDYFQRVEGKPWLFDHCSPCIGIREGRRVVGDYILKLEDLRAGRRFDDAVARGVYHLDGHKPDDDKRSYILPREELSVPPYQIPYRCLLVKDAANLLAAGRCISADQLPLSSARVTTTCSMLGQAAGIAAAQAAARNAAPRDLDPQAIRAEVERRGAFLE